MKHLAESIHERAVTFFTARGQNIRITPAIVEAAMNEGADLALQAVLVLNQETRQQIRAERRKSNMPD